MSYSFTLAILNLPSNYWTISADWDSAAIASIWCAVFAVCKSHPPSDGEIWNLKSVCDAENWNRMHLWLLFEYSIVLIFNWCKIRCVLSGTYACHIPSFTYALHCIVGLKSFTDFQLVREGRKWGFKITSIKPVFWCMGSVPLLCSRTTIIHHHSPADSESLDSRNRSRFLWSLLQSCACFDAIDMI